MENQQTQQTKKENGAKRLPMVGLITGIIITACIIIWLVFGDASSSRQSSPSEITAQEEFQDKLMTTQKGFQQKIEVATKEAEQKSDSILKAAEHK